MGKGKLGKWDGEVKKDEIKEGEGEEQDKEKWRKEE